jgi:hypothetical protein
MSDHGFEPVEKYWGGAKAMDPMITLRDGSMNILTVAYQEMGEPDAVRFFYKDDCVAIVPADPEHKDSYAVTADDESGSASVSVGWLDGELWVADFNDPEGEQV